MRTFCYPATVTVDTAGFFLVTFPDVPEAGTDAETRGALRMGLRNWFPDIHQMWIIVINPGSLLVLLFAAWSLLILKHGNSVRLAAVSLFTCFLVGFTIVTYFAVVHRGPNWHFYWWPSQWPVH